MGPCTGRLQWIFLWQGQVPAVDGAEQNHTRNYRKVTTTKFASRDKYGNKVYDFGLEISRYGRLNYASLFYAIALNYYPLKVTCNRIDKEWY